MENCPYCNEFMDIAADTQNCTHRSIDPQNEFCCPNCNTHFDLKLNEVSTDKGIARPALSGGEYIPPPPAPEPTPPSDSKSDSSTESNTKPATPTKPKLDSIYAPPQAKSKQAKKCLKA